MLVVSRLSLVMLFNVGCMLHAMEETAAKRQKDIHEQLSDAATWGYIQKVQELIDAGADVNAQNIIGQTALIEAVQSGDKNIVTLLLKHGANANVNAIYSYTALMNAAYWGYKDIAELLLIYGAHVNTQIRGWTALMWAVNGRSIDVVELLLAYGADINLKNNDGKTALDLAREGTKDREVYQHIEVILVRASARSKLCALWQEAARGYVAQYPGTPVQEIVKYLKY